MFGRSHCASTTIGADASSGRSSKAATSASSDDCVTGAAALRTTPAATPAPMASRRNERHHVADAERMAVDERGPRHGGGGGKRERQHRRRARVCSKSASTARSTPAGDAPTISSPCPLSVAHAPGRLRRAASTGGPAPCFPARRSRSANQAPTTTRLKTTKAAIASAG